jgi:hypothetical protein
MLVPITPDIIVEANYIVRFIAVDATTMAAVSGVKVNTGAILGTDLTQANAIDDSAPNPLLIPTE